MGSRKDEMRSPAEDHQRCETTEDQVSPGSTDISPAPEGPQTDISQQSTSQVDDQSKLHANAGNVEEGGEDLTPKDPTISKGLGGDTDQLDSILAQDCIQTLDTVLQTQQTDAELNLPVKPLPGMQGEEMISPQSTPDEFPADLTPMDGGSEERGKPSEGKEKDGGIEDKGEEETVGLPVSSAQDPPAPGTPAPFGQQHMRTQVSLEVVQCHSVATSPMTPPEGDQAFSFPYSSGRSMGAETKDAELQVGRQVEFRSVATAPMTPRTPTIPATFPEISGGEREHTEERTRERVEQGQTDNVQQESCTMTKCPAEAESGPGIESIPALKCNTPKEATEGIGSNSFASPENSINNPPTALGSSLETLEDSKQQCKQHGQRMGSMDQDITILVTHHDNTEAEYEEGGVDTESSINPTGQEVAKTDDSDEFDVNTSDAVQKAIEVDSVLGKVATIKQISTEHSNDGKNVGPCRVHDTTIISTNPLQNKGNIEGPSIQLSKHPQTEKDHLGQNKQMSGIKETKEEDTCCGVEPEEVSQISEPKCPLTNPADASSPAPFGQQHMRTQVSLEVVQCHSVATSPMTPPEGDQVFSFPYSSGRSTGTEKKDAELQVGQQVEFRSVATAPMTPETLTAPTGFPEIRKEERIENILEEEDKEKKKPMATEKAAEDKNVLTRGDIKEEVVEEKTDVNGQEEKALKEKCAEMSEEPVQEVSWDEKGMTWEVYGAVVEVTVLGSAIQKHLEKQVKKHRKQPSLPPPPPLSPSAMPLTLTPTSPPTLGSAQGSSGKKKRGERDGKLNRRRRNPFRMMLQNMQQPHCCSREHATE